MLELLAMATMLVDHIGAVFYPQVPFWRIVGRLAMPLYAWGIVKGYQHTRSRSRYALRLFGLALVSQPLAMGLFQEQELNIVFGFLAAVGLFALLDAIPRWFERIPALPGRSLWGWNAQVIAICWAFQGFVLIPVDYGPYLLALLLLYRGVAAKWVLLVGHVLLNLLFFGFHSLQMWSVLGTVLLILPVPWPPLRRGRWFYRIFYPLHLAVLLAISQFLTALN